ncbi:hypothetical protein [Microbacterium sp. NPDC087665]|uniref:hypothetical protein n=1 Tax=Microbacterium sp. NPDC087665 TaxID=3364194 RepID=UPI0038298B85
MSDPQTYPDDSGPFDAAAATAPGEKVFTADDGEDHDADDREGEELDPLEQGDETNVDPDMGISN